MIPIEYPSLEGTKRDYVEQCEYKIAQGNCDKLQLAGWSLGIRVSCGPSMARTVRDGETE